MRRRFAGPLLLAATTLVVSGCGIAARAIAGDEAGPDAGTRRVKVLPAPIDRQACAALPTEILECDEKLWADTAWTYVENNTQGNGLVNATSGRAIVSMWDVADAIAAAYAARELGMINTCTFDSRMGRLLGVLNTIPLVDEIAPNRWYDTTTLQMVDVEGRPAIVGWSAVDLGRLLLWLKIVEKRHPIWSQPIGRAMARWNFCGIVDACGTLSRGVRTAEGENRVEQEGRLGYEEYAAGGFAAWGFDVRQAEAIEPSRALSVGGVALRLDARPSARDHNTAALTTTPFALHEMELGATRDHRQYRQLGRDVARAQYERYRATRTMTARTHRPVGWAPWMVYDSVYVDGYEWNPVDATGKSFPYLAVVSTAAAFELWAAYPDPVADIVLEYACSLRDPERGWFNGRFEQSGGAEETLSLRTNAAVLESLLYKTFGTIDPQETSEPSWFAEQARDEFFRPGRCLPAESRECGECPQIRGARAASPLLHAAMSPAAPVAQPERQPAAPLPATIPAKTPRTRMHKSDAGPARVAPAAPAAPVSVAATPSRPAAPLTPGQERERLLQMADAAWARGEYVQAAALFGQAGPFGAGEEELAYHAAVAFYETGAYRSAKLALTRALPRLERTPEVVRYQAKIEGAIEW